MLDLDFIRENPDVVQQAASDKGEDVDLDEILEIDQERRNLQHELDQKRHERNEGSEKVGELKQKGEDASDLIEELSRLSDDIQEGEQRLSGLEEELKDRAARIPNLPADDVPVGEDEEANEVIRVVGEAPSYDVDPMPHWDLGKDLGILDIERSSKLSGRGFYVLNGDGALLERAMLNWMLDLQTNRNEYEEVQVPYLNRPEALEGTGQIPKLERDMYKTQRDELYLIPTSEVPLINLHRDEILDEEDLPIHYTSGTPCFRREAGAAGSDTRGMIRVHQFNKVELVKICQSSQVEHELEELLFDAEEILQELNLHYRVILLCTGDLSFASRKTFDLEVWAPGSEQWLEVSSVSTCSDFQARRCNLRYRDEDGELQYPHTLNGSGVALARTVIAVLEQHQNADGTVEVPDPLIPYMNGRETIS